MGADGRDFCLKNGLTAEQMGNKMIEMFNYLFATDRNPRAQYTLTKVESKSYTNTGIV